MTNHTRPTRSPQAFPPEGFAVLKDTPVAKHPQFPFPVKLSRFPFPVTEKMCKISIKGWTNYAAVL